MVFHWSLSDRNLLKSLSILADLKDARVWMFSTHPLISKSSSPFINLLVTVLRAPVTICINITFMFQGFFQYRWKVKVFALLFIFIQFYSMVNWDKKVHNFASSLFLLLIIMRSGCLTKIRWPVWDSKSQRCLCVSFSRTAIRLSIWLYGQISISCRIPCGSFFPPSRV